MTLFYRSVGFLAVGASLMAQSPKALLKLIPTTAEHVELTWNPATAEAAYRAALTGVDTHPNLMGLDGKVHVNVKDLAPGPVAVAFWPKVSVGTESASPQPEVVFVPIKDAKAFAAHLNAKAEGGVQQYSWTGANGAESRYLAFRGPYALISRSKALIQDTMKVEGGLDTELESMLPWLTARATAVVITASGTTKGLADIASGLDPKGPPSPAKAFLGEQLRGWVTKAQASIHHIAVALDFPEPGTVRVTGRAFFSPGSVLSKEAADASAPPAVLMGALPEAPFALALGGGYPEAFNFMSQMALQDPELTDAQRADYKAVLEKDAGLTESFSLSVEPPVEGQPFFSGISTYRRIKDIPAWLAAAKAQEDFARARMGEGMTVEHGTFEGRPTIITSVDLNTMAKGKLPPEQMGMFSALLFGGNRMVTSQAVLDDHNVIMVFGGKDRLEAAIAKAKQGPAFKGLGKTNALLPEGARFGIYAHPKGLETLYTTVTTTLGLPPGKQGAPLPSVPPLGGVLTLDPGGMQFTGVAKTETLVAFKSLFSNVGEAIPGKKPATGKGHVAH